MQGVINVCYRPRVRLCGEERARLGPATSGTAESAASHSFLQSVQPLSGSLNLGFNSTRTSPENRTDQTLFFFYHKNCRAPKNGSILVGDDFSAVFDFSSTSPNLPTSVCHSAQFHLSKQLLGNFKTSIVNISMQSIFSRKKI